MLPRSKKDEMLRARCGKDLKDDVDLIARLKGVDSSDIVRIACRELVQKFKTPALAQQNILLHG